MKSPPCNPKNNRILTILLSMGGIFGIFMLAASLPNMVFQPGIPLTPGGTRSIFPIGASKDITWLTSICLTALLALVPMGLIMVVVSPEARRIFKRNLIICLAASILAWDLSRFCNHLELAAPEDDIIGLERSHLRNLLFCSLAAISISYAAITLAIRLSFLQSVFLVLLGIIGLIQLSRRISGSTRQ